MKKGRVNAKAKYTEEEIRSNRTFPTGNTVLLAIIIAVQIGLIILGICYQSLLSFSYAGEDTACYFSPRHCCLGETAVQAKL